MAALKKAPSHGAADLLELEHVIGYTGRHKNVLSQHPSHDSGFLYGLGANVTLADVTDPHEQIFLRGHTADVSAIDISASARLIASGQSRAPTSATGEAPVIVWDASTRARLHTFSGITLAVNAVRISQDDAFVAACGVDMMLCIWDVATGEQLLGKRMGVPVGDVPGISVLTWAPIDMSQRRPKYYLAFNAMDRIHVAALEYDYKTMKYGVAIHATAVPSSGFARMYTCGGLDQAGTTLLCGTMAGELVSFALTPLPVFKGSLQASSHGVHSIVAPTLPSGASTSHGAIVYCGGGDGSIRCFVGREASWVCVAEAAVLGKVVTMTIAASGAWMLVGSELGQVYRVSWGSGLGEVPRGARAATDLLETSHTRSVTGMSFMPGQSDAVATVGADGTARIWSLETYDMRWIHYATGGGTPMCVWLDAPIASAGPASALPIEARAPAGFGHASTRGGGTGAMGGGAVISGGVSGPTAGGIPSQMYAGFTDGTLRAYDIFGPTGPDGRGSVEAWKVMAHKGGVTCMSGNRAAIVTGGADGRVCIWSRKSSTLLLQFSEHTKPVLAVHADFASLETVYSVGQDRLINTYNLRTERRMKSHTFSKSDGLSVTFSALCQNMDPVSERELFTGTSDGRIFCWDVDVPDVPVGVVDLLALLPREYVPNTPIADALPPAASVSAMRARSAAAGSSAAYVTGSSGAPVRPDLHITALAVSSSGRLLAVATSSGLIAVLEMGPSGTAIVAPATVAARSAGPVGSLSKIGNMTLAAVFSGLSPYTDIKWTPDGKQCVATGQDGCISVFNWYGM